MSDPSTIPGAITTLQGYLQTVADNNPSLNLTVAVGWPIGTVPNSWLMLGSFAQEGSDIITGWDTDWTGFPAGRRSETYTLNGSVVVWSGNVDPIGRITDAFTVLDAIQSEIVSDPQGSGTLSSSGSWGEFKASSPTTGPFEMADGTTTGWGVVVEFTLDVINVRLNP
jgi:hypothetical protein